MLRNSGLETKNLSICMRRDWVMLVMSISSLRGRIIAEMVLFSFLDYSYLNEEFCLCCSNTLSISSTDAGQGMYPQSNVLRHENHRLKRDTLLKRDYPQRKKKKKLAL